MADTKAPVLNQVRLLVDDFAATFRFYRDVVSLEVGYGTEDEEYASFHAGATDIAIFRRDLMQQTIGHDIAAPGQALGATMMAFEVANVDASWERMRAAGGVGLAEPTDRPDWGIRTAQLRDPAGNIVEVFVALSRPE